MSGVSTSDAILELTEMIYTSLNTKKITVNIMIDFQKAFDLIDPNILLRKLEKYGIRGVSLQLISTFLTNRSSVVKINDCHSKSKPLKLGLPQGSVLSPILFIIFINDLPNISENFKSVLYADDTSLCFQNSNPTQFTETCNFELDNFLSWTYCNRLLVNFEKTRILKISNLRNSNLGAIRLGSYNLEHDRTFKLLGVVLDENMKFDAHIQSITKKISISIGIMYRIKNYLSFNVLKSLYYSFIYSYLSYGIIIWGGTYHVHLQPLITLQKRAIRIINKQPYLAHTNVLFFQNKILKLGDIYKFFIAVHFYKKKLYLNLSRNHQYPTRFRFMLLPTYSRLVVSSQSIYSRGAAIWNEIPENIKNSKSVSIFKRKFKKFYLAQYDSEYFFVFLVRNASLAYTLGFFLWLGNC